jgi:hypothetical protein
MIVKMQLCIPVGSQQWLLVTAIVGGKESKECKGCLSVLWMGVDILQHKNF